MRFMDLPVETILQVLVNIPCVETYEIINKLSRSGPKIQESSIIGLLYQRLYQDKLILTVNDTASGKCHNTLTIDDFEEKFANESYESRMFQKVSPKTFEISLIRPPNDYIHYIKKLYKLNRLLNSEERNIVTYLASVKEISIDVDGYSLMVDNPTSLSVIVLKVLCSISIGELTPKVSTIKITSTDIGTICPQMWLQVFQNFPSIHYLNLSNNLISSKVQEYPDLLESYLKIPCHLKELHLDSNLITQISNKLVTLLPDQLEVLSLRRNRLSSIGVEPQDRFNISRALPKLKLLKLSHNHNLTLINLEIFTGMKTSNFCMDIKGCNIVPAIMNDISTLFAERCHSLLS